MPENAEIGTLLCERFARFEKLPALWLDGETVSYAQLFSDASALVERIVDSTDTGDRIGLLAQRSYPAYAGILASILSNRPYVPINMKFPLERQISIASIAGCALLITDRTSAARGPQLIQAIGPALREIATPEVGDTDADTHRKTYTGHGTDFAYIMFTSGTTGVPKGVAVRRENLSAYLSAVETIAPIAPETRCTQLFDLSFDLSVHDVFQTWASGGCLYIANNDEMMDPVGFARRHALQAWFSVPSVVAMAQRFRRLQPGILPEMRTSLFCGEPLPASIAGEWAKAAPNSRIWNLYGPTEATIAITAEEYDPAAADRHGPATVPLGKAFSGSAAIVVDDSGQQSQLGELWLGGAQISSGYINNEGENRAKFVTKTFPDQPYQRWYRTGDLVQRDPRHGLMFQGRMDGQAKIQGYRVELLEIEEALRHASGSAEVAAVLWPISAAGAAEGVVGFVCAPTKMEREILDACRASLPVYASPKKIIVIDGLPLNANGKVDRNALRDTYLRKTPTSSEVAKSELS
jgi:amino acid adenylation domain-containing protein